jgi:hypothetical protein
MTIAGARRNLYKTARFLGDVQAIRRGRVHQRIWNRVVGRILGGIVRGIMK